MSHSYAFTPKNVLRHLDWSLVVQYWQQRFPDRPLSCLEHDEPDVDSMVEAINALEPSAQADAEIELKEIYDLATEEGTRLIAQEASFLQINFTEEFASLKGGPYDVAMWALLNFPVLFSKASRFWDVDNFDRRLWRPRRGLENIEPDTSSGALERFSRSLSSYLVREEARGERCKVEWVPRSTGHLFVAYPEDFGETYFEYDNSDELVRRTIKPARDILFFYDPVGGMLDIYCRGTQKRVADLQMLFALSILNTALGPALPSDRTYDLDLLLRDDFRFQVDSLVGVQAIVVKQLHLQRRDGRKPITLYPDIVPGRGMMLELSEYFSTVPGEASDKPPLYLASPDKVKLQALFHPVGKKKGKSRTFTLTRTGCLLDHEGNDLLIRRVLAASGIEQTGKALVAA